jgi:hypothetical protein
MRWVGDEVDGDEVGSCGSSILAARSSIRQKIFFFHQILILYK